MGAQSENALTNLRTILEVNARVSRENQSARLPVSVSEDLREVLEDILASATEHSDALHSIIREWESSGRRPRTTVRPTVEHVLEPREFIESWLAIKESAAELYRKAAREAPNDRLRRKLDALAKEEEHLASRLKAML